MIAADGTIYVGSSAGVYARTSSGAAKWTNPTTPGIGTGAAPTIGADGTVYYVTTGTSSAVRALTPGTTSPTQKWISATSALGGASSSSPLLSADGATVYATSRAGKLAALRTFTESGGSAGSMRWVPAFTTPGSSPISGSPAFGVDGTLYVGADNGLYAVNPVNGVQITSKSYTTGTPVVRTTPAVGPDGTLYFGTDNMGLVAVKDGVLRWKYPASGAAPVIRSSPAVGGDGTIYFGTRTIPTPATAGKLIALNPDGTLKWSHSAAGNIDATPAIGADGMVYVTADDKKFYALRQSGTTTSAEVRMNIALGTGSTAYARSAMSISRSGGVLAPAEDGKLSAFGPGNCRTSDTSCDGTDDNCNGSIDEGYVAHGTSCGVGACVKAGTSSCLNGAEQTNCTPGTPAASDTTCNNLDENCNGAKDEGFVGSTTSCGIGACANTGTSSCVSGVVQDNCTPGAPAASDATCNNSDDDCDGSKDEEFVSTQVSCGVGACLNSANISCISGVAQNACTPRQKPSQTDATCDGVDDNCDGIFDEHCNLATSPGANLLRNGTFDLDLNSVWGLKNPLSGPPEQAPELFTRETLDTANGSQGALRVRIVKTPGYTWATHNGGVVLQTSEPIAADTTLLFTFWAKSVSGGKILSFTRIWGDLPARARLTTSWQQYQTYVRITHDGSDAFVVNLSPTDDDNLRTIEDGEFLIDEVTLRKVPDAPRRCGAAYDQPCSPTCTTPACSPTAIDTVSRPATAVYSQTARLRSAYTDAGLRVRRASDQAELNVGYGLDHRLDMSTLSSFCGNSDCYLTVLYDQSGNGRDLRQVRTTLQPKLYDGTTQQLSVGHEVLVLPSDQGQPYLWRINGVGLVGNSGAVMAVAARYGNAAANPGYGFDVAMSTPAGPYQLSGRAASAGYYFGGGISWPVSGSDGLKRLLFVHPAGGNNGASGLRLDNVDLGPGQNPSGNVNVATNFGAQDMLRVFSQPTLALETLVVWDAELGAADAARVDIALMDPGASGGSSLASLSPPMREAYVNYEASATKPGSLGALTSSQALLAQFENGCIYYFSEYGAHVVHGPTCARYMTLGAERSALGHPVADSTTVPNSTGPSTLTRFEYGDLYWSNETGAHTVLGDYRAAYVSAGVAAMGLPQEDSPSANALTTQYFQLGAIYAGPAGLVPVSGELYQRYRDLGEYHFAMLGYPTSFATGTEIGTVVNFEGGFIATDPSGALRVRYKNQALVADLECDDPQNCNPCAHDVETQFLALTSQYDIDDWYKAPWFYDYEQAFQPSNLRGEDAYIDRGFSLESPGIQKNHVQGFIRVGGRYAMAFNDSGPDGTDDSGDESGTLTLIQPSPPPWDWRPNGIVALHRAEEGHPSAVFPMGRWVGLMTKLDDVRSILFYNEADPLAEPVRRSLPADNHDAQPGQGAAMVRMPDGYLTMTTQDRDGELWAYWNMLRGNSPNSPPTEEGGQDEFLGRAPQPALNGRAWQSTSLITECGTGHVYAIHVDGTDFINIPTGLPTETSGSGYWNLSQVFIKDGTPYVVQRHRSTVDQVAAFCWTAGGASASADANGNLHLVCSSRSSSAADTGGRTGPNDTVYQFGIGDHSGQYRPLPVGTPGSGDTLHAGELLRPDMNLTSQNGRYRLLYQLDGNLVLYDDWFIINGFYDPVTGIATDPEVCYPPSEPPSIFDLFPPPSCNPPLWGAGVHSDLGELLMQTDGNLVIYGVFGTIPWNSETQHHPGSRLLVQNDGNVVIYDANDHPIWATETAD